jgi:hypothetical protein
MKCGCTPVMVEGSEKLRVHVPPDTDQLLMWPMTRKSHFIHLTHRRGSKLEPLLSK